MDKIAKPLFPFEVFKLANELDDNVFARTYRLKTIGLRYFNIFDQMHDPMHDPNGEYSTICTSN